jgi:NAD(P)-dependent dehydrogenase (short-subunit alcohol dehydrogenase family)
VRSFTGRVAAITGAGSGIGRALALRLAAEGCHLSLADVDPDGLAATADLLADAPVTVTTHLVDVADGDAVQRWADDTVAAPGGVHLVVNNAGVAQGGTVEGTSLDDYAWVLGINLWGVIHGTKAFLPHLRAAGEGHVVNISSVFGLQAQPGVSAYNTSKFGVRGFTESLRQELDVLDVGVSATCVHPGGIATGINRRSRTNESLGSLFGVSSEETMGGFDRLLRIPPDTAARVILAGVPRDRRRVLIGPEARLLDWLVRLLPTGYQHVNRALVRSAARRAGRAGRPGRGVASSQPQLRDGARDGREVG